MASTHMEHLQPEVLLLVFLPIYQSMSPAGQECYQEIVTPIPNKPQIKVMLTLLPISSSNLPSSISSPSSLSISLVFQISSQPMSPTETLIPELGFLQENALLIVSFVGYSPAERQVMASPTWVLPSTYMKPPATPSTWCFLCHNFSHYRGNCPCYQCLHYQEMAPEHPLHLCMWTQCTFCQYWSHSNQACPQWLCRDCNQPGHISDDCLFSNLFQEQTAHIDRAPLWPLTRGIDHACA